MKRKIFKVLVSAKLPHAKRYASNGFAIIAKSGAFIIYVWTLLAGLLPWEMEVLISPWGLLSGIFVYGMIFKKSYVAEHKIKHQHTPKYH